MNEQVTNLVIGAFLGFVELLTTILIGCVAHELRLLRTTLEKKVDKDDCTKDMCRHYQEIQNLWKETREQGERIARIEPHDKWKGR